MCYLRTGRDDRLVGMGQDPPRQMSGRPNIFMRVTTNSRYTELKMLDMDSQAITAGTGTV